MKNSLEIDTVIGNKTSDESNIRNPFPTINRKFKEMPGFTYNNINYENGKRKQIIHGEKPTEQAQSNCAQKKHSISKNLTEENSRWSFSVLISNLFVEIRKLTKASSF